MDAKELNDIEKLRKANRLALGKGIPAKLAELSEILAGCQDRVEDWYVLVLLQIAMSAHRVCRDLLKIEDDETVPPGFGSLPAVAWNVRNLLELWVWMEYCCASRDNARRFYEDAIRDAQGFADSFFKISDLVGGSGRELEPYLRERIDIAARAIGLETVDAGFLNVADAAKAVGIDNWYSPCNKFYSKLAHPTALLVTKMIHDPEFSQQMAVVLKTDGGVFAHGCELALEKMLQRIPPAATQSFCRATARGSRGMASPPSQKLLQKRKSLNEQPVTRRKKSEVAKVKRSTAEKMLNEVISRVETIRAGTLPFAWSVSKLIVYGSYLRDVEKLGDLDLAVQLAPRLADAQGQRKLFDERCASPHNPKRGLDRTSWPREEVWRFIKNRHHTISLHEFEDFLYMEKDANFAYRVLIGDTAEVEAALRRTAERQKQGS